MDPECVTLVEISIMRAAYNAANQDHGQDVPTEPGFYWVDGEVTDGPYENRVEALKAMETRCSQ